MGRLPRCPGDNEKDGQREEIFRAGIPVTHLQQDWRSLGNVFWCENAPHGLVCNVNLKKNKKVLPFWLRQGMKSLLNAQMLCGRLKGALIFPIRCFKWGDLKRLFLFVWKLAGWRFDFTNIAYVPEALLGAGKGRDDTVPVPSGGTQTHPHRSQCMLWQEEIWSPFGAEVLPLALVTPLEVRSRVWS